MSLRPWQVDARHKINEISKKESHTLIAVNACVGSGKTTVAMQAMRDFIESHPNELTLQVFVCPRLALCDQQINEIDNYMSGLSRVCTILWNCEGEKPKELYDYNQHTILVACDKSIWDGKLPKKLLESRVCGVIAYDESHNYFSHVQQMYGYKDEENVKPTNDEGYSKYFQINLFMSGTPHDYQKILSEQWHSIDLSIREALIAKDENGKDTPYICKPTLNLVKSLAYDVFDSTHIRDAIRVVKDYENCFYENIGCMQPRILVCMDGIDTIENIRTDFGDDCHVIGLHSNKKKDIDNAPDVFQPTIDGDRCSKEDVMNLLDEIDAGTAEILKDKKPIIVLQVDMISEGVNIKSFNSVFITSHSQTKQMQQIGRVLRHFKTDTFDKAESGLAHIYVPISNKDEVGELLYNLEQAGLTENCFEWGKICDVSNSTAENQTTDLPTKELKWVNVEDYFNLTIEELYKMGDETWNGKVLRNVMNINLSEDVQKKLIKLANAMSGGKLKDFVNKTKSEKGSKKTACANKTPEKEKTKEKEVDVKTLQQALRKLYKELLLNGLSEKMKTLYSKNEVLYYKQILHDQELAELVKNVFEKLELRLR